MKRLVKRLGEISIIMALVVSMTACSFGNSDSKSSSDTKQSTKTTKENSNVTQDAKKTEKLKKEKAVADGQVYIQNNVATATMVIKDNVSESDAKALADKYAKELKESHKDMKVNVQAVQKGKNIADITIEK